MKNLMLVVILICFAGISALAQDTIPSKIAKKPHKSFLVDERPFTFEIPLWIPGFRGDFAFGDFNIEGGDGLDPGDPGDPGDDEEGNIFQKIFSKNFFLKFFYLTRIVYEKKNFLAQLDGLTGAVGEEVQFNYNNEDIVKLEVATINVRLLAGYRVVDTWSGSRNFRYELYPYVGLRYHNHTLRSWFLDEKEIFDLQPGWIEPIAGIQNQFSWNRWFLLFSADMGGFFINNKYSFQGNLFGYYRVGRALSLKLGWTLLNMNHNSEHLGEELKMSMFLNGPTVGLAIQF